jgi:hypothetical protein
MHDERGRAAQQPRCLVLVAEALVGLDDEHHPDPGVPEPLGQVDRRAGAVGDGGELLEVDGHALVVAVLAGHPVVAEVLQQQPEGGAGVLAGGQHRQAEDGQVGVIVAPGAVEAALEGVEEVAIAQRRPLEPLGAGDLADQLGPIGAGVQLLQPGAVSRASSSSAARGGPMSAPQASRIAREATRSYQGSDQSWTANRRLASSIGSPCQPDRGSAGQSLTRGANPAPAV